MNRKWMVLGGGILFLALVIFACAPSAVAGAQEKPSAAAGAQEKPSYTVPEYNAYQAAANEKNPQQRIKLLDDFVAKFPSSTLLPYVYRLYYNTYNELKNFSKVMEYADRELSFGDKLDSGTRLEALYIRALAFHGAFNEKAPDAKQQATRAREAALEGLKVLSQLTKPPGLTDEQFAQNKKQPEALFNYTAGFAALQSKEYKAAIDSFKAALAINPNDGVTYFRMGVAYLQMEPPQYMDGFWALARSVALKGPGEAQVRSYLRNQLLRYQQTGCDKLLDAQMNELLTLAASSAERPVTYKIPSAADLENARKQAEAENFITVLKAGGDRAKLLWLATCGLEFPEVAAKVIAVNADSPVVLKLFIGVTPEETEAGTAANMEVKLEGQPEAKRLQSGDFVRFSATLAGYDQDPFMLHWEKGKVNPEDLHEEKGPPGKRPRRPPKKSGR